MGSKIHPSYLTMGGATGWEPGRIGGGRGTGGRREKLGGRVPRGLEAGKKVYMV